MNCKNCYTELDEQDDYCSRCGGKVIRKRLSFKNLFEHLSETFFNYDNKLLRTFVQLFREPEDVIAGYINGVRKRYINPISFFGLSLTISGLSLFIIKKFYIQHLDFAEKFGGINKEIFDQTSSGIFEYNSLFYSFLIPFFAFISWIVFLNKKYNFTEHIIIYLYSMSMLSVLLAFATQIVLMLIPDSYFTFSLLTWPLMFIYHCYILTRIFKLSFGDLLLRSIIFFALFFVAYILTSIIAFVIMLMTGTINLEDFRPK
ncbi:MAG: hypothetical protein Tsb0033_25850 [Winogradskyella sp.]